MILYRIDEMMINIRIRNIIKIGIRMWINIHIRTWIIIHVVYIHVRIINIIIKRGKSYCTTYSPSKVAVLPCCSHSTIVKI